MTQVRSASLLGRLRSLLRGLFSVWIRDRELDSPEAVYEQAIRGRMNQYRELKGAVAGILYMRGKLEGEIVYSHVGHADVATKSFTDRAIPGTVNSAAYIIRGVRGNTAGPASMPMVVGFGRAIGTVSKAA